MGARSSPGAGETIHAPPGSSGRGAQPRDAVISTDPSPTFVQVTDSGPALMLSPSAQETLASPTPRVARPSFVPANFTVVPRISAETASPLRVAVHVLPEQETLSELREQPVSASAPASSPVAILRVRTCGEAMGRAWGAGPAEPGMSGSSGGGRRGAVRGGTGVARCVVRWDD